MNDEMIHEIQINEERQPEVRQRTPDEQARDEFALLTLLHARLENGSDLDVIFPLPSKRGLQA